MARATALVEHEPRRLPRRHRAVQRIGLMLDAATGAAPTLFAAWVAALLLLLTQSPLLALLSALGFGGAFVAGLVGVGGAVIMIPLLLYLPPLAGFPTFDMHVVAGISMVQVAAASTTGMLAHRQIGHVSAPLVAAVGGPLTLASFGGALVSDFVPPQVLSAMFAALAAVAAALMLRDGRSATVPALDTPVRFSRWRAVALGTVVGLLVGMVGAGGGFLLVPLMMYGLGVPVREAVGSSLAIVTFGGLGGLVGKALSGQVLWIYALSLVVGALPGARLGATTSARISGAMLAQLLGVLLALIAARMWWDLLH